MTDQGSSLPKNRNFLNFTVVFRHNYRDHPLIFVWKAKNPRTWNQIVSSFGSMNNSGYTILIIKIIATITNAFSSILITSLATPFFLQERT